jgi:hypothetical protein
MGVTVAQGEVGFAMVPQDMRQLSALGFPILGLQSECEQQMIREFGEEFLPA